MRKAALLAGGALVLGLVGTASVWAGPTPQGGPFRATSCTNCREDRPSVAGTASGGFLAVWEGASATDLKGINGRLFNNTGAAAAADFQVNKDPVPDQYDVAVTRDAQGNFVVVWSEVVNGNSEIMGQRFLATGAPTGNPFKVNLDAAGTAPPPSDFNPAVTATKTGFVVVWVNLMPTGTPRVMARRFNTTGAPLGPQIVLSTGLVNGDRPSVCADTAGGIVAVWTSVDAFRPFQSNLRGVSLRRLTPAGVVNGPEQVVAPPTASSLLPAVSCGSGSTFVVVWHSDQGSVERTDIFGQRYSRLGRKTGAAFRINSTVTRDQKSPAIAHDTKGNFVVVWQADLGSREGIYGRRYTAKGAPSGSDFEVVSDAENGTHPINPKVAMVGTTGNFVVVWQEGTKAIMGRRFTP